MSPNFLYSASLETHMNKYMEGVKLGALNQQYQLLQAKVVREGERMLMDQATIINKLEELKNQFKAEIAQSQKPIAFSKSSAPEKIIEKEKYKPMTASEYENVIRKGKPIIENRKQLINELKDRKNIQNKNKTITELKDRKNIQNLLNDMTTDVKNKKQLIDQLKDKNIVKNLYEDMITDVKNKLIMEDRNKPIIKENKFKKVLSKNQIKKEKNLLKKQNLILELERAGIKDDLIPKQLKNKDYLSVQKLNNLRTELLATLKKK